MIDCSSFSSSSVRDKGRDCEEELARDIIEADNTAQYLTTGCQPLPFCRRLCFRGSVLSARIVLRQAVLESSGVKEDGAGPANTVVGR